VKGEAELVILDPFNPSLNYLNKVKAKTIGGKTAFVLAF